MLVLRHRQWTPRRLVGNGLAVWYNAPQISGVLEGATIPQWDDLSGNARHLLQATDSLRPILKNGIQNNRAVVRFDGTDDYLATSAATNLAQPSTHFWVARALVTVTAATPLFVDTQAAGGTHRQSVYIDPTDPEHWALFDSTNGGTVSTTTADTSFHIFEMIFNGASSSLLLDGTTIVTKTASATLDLLKVGNGAFAGTAWNGDVGEGLIVGAVMGSNDRAQVRQYLRRGWATP